MHEATLLAALPLIRMAASRLNRTLRSADYNEDDLHQDLALELLKKISRFDSRRASLARFVWVIANHRVAEIRRRELAQRRDRRQNLVD